MNNKRSEDIIEFNDPFLLSGSVFVLLKLFVWLLLLSIKHNLWLIDFVSYLYWEYAYHRYAWCACFGQSQAFLIRKARKMLGRHRKTILAGRARNHEFCAERRYGNTPFPYQLYKKSVLGMAKWGLLWVKNSPFDIVNKQ